MASRFLSAAFTAFTGRWTRRRYARDPADNHSPLRMTTRQMLDDHMMRDIGLYDGSGRPRRRKHLSEF